jgi:hypothetical protein
MEPLKHRTKTPLTSAQTKERCMALMTNPTYNALSDYKWWR